MIRYREGLTTGYIRITVDGPMDRVEFDVIADQLKEAIGRHGAVSVLEDIQDFTGNEPFFFWDELGLSLRHLNEASRCAVVADPAWIGLIATSVAPCVACELKHFMPTDFAHARLWLNSRKA